MDLQNFVQNIKFYCSVKGVKPTVACKEAGVGQSFINNMELKGSVPSVEKCQQMAHYLGVTVSELLGEVSNPNALSDLPTGPPGTLLLHDSAAVLQSTDVKRLTVSEVEMVMAYRMANADDRMIVDAALRKYRKKETTSGAG